MQIQEKSVYDWIDQNLRAQLEHEDIAITAITAVLETPDHYNVDLHVDDDYDDENDANNFYIGNYADPGMSIKPFGEFAGPDGETRTLLLVNGVVMEAFAKHIVGWVIGYNGDNP